VPLLLCLVACLGEPSASIERVAGRWSVPRNAVFPIPKTCPSPPDFDTSPISPILERLDFGTEDTTLSSQKADSFHGTEVVAIQRAIQIPVELRLFGLVDISDDTKVWILIPLTVSSTFGRNSTTVFPESRSSTPGASIVFVGNVLGQDLGKHQQNR
jgi:hypothetical protein